MKPVSIQGFEDTDLRCHAGLYGKYQEPSRPAEGLEANFATIVAVSMVVLICQGSQERLNFICSVHVDVCDKPKRDKPIIFACQNRTKRSVIINIEIGEKSEANTYQNGLKKERRDVGDDLASPGPQRSLVFQGSCHDHKD